jgi:hypothetical protein
MMTAPTAPTLYERLVDLFGRHDVHPDDKDQILKAFDKAEKFEDLPPQIRQKIEQLEKDLPRQAWDDPADVPDNLEDL